MKRVILILIFLIDLTGCATKDASFSRLPAASEFETLVPPHVGKQWQYSFQPTSRTVSIADLHGDFDAFVKILIEQKLIDSKGKWIGGDARLVLLGDLLDRGHQGRYILRYLMQLEVDAVVNGGAVHTLLGNHELLLMEGYHKYVSAKEAMDFFKPEHNYTLNIARKKYLQYFTSNNEITTWLRSKPVMIKIGDTLFTHGGLEKWVLVAKPSNINFTVGAWANYFTKNGPKPPSRTKWVLSGEGPTWSRKMASGELRQAQVEDYLKSVNAKRVVLGHTIQDAGVRVSYQGRVILSDTGMSSVYGGRLSSVEFNKETSFKPQLKHFSREKTGTFSEKFGQFLNLKFHSCGKLFDR